LGTKKKSSYKRATAATIEEKLKAGGYGSLGAVRTAISRATGVKGKDKKTLMAKAEKHFANEKPRRAKMRKTNGKRAARTGASYPVAFAHLVGDKAALKRVQPFLSAAASSGQSLAQVDEDLRQFGT
jgi:hypothetical protein